MKPFVLLLLALALLALLCAGCTAHNRSLAELQAEHLVRPGLTPADMVTITPFKGAPFQVPRSLYTTVMIPADDGWNLVRHRVERFCERKPSHCPDGTAPVMLINMKRIDKTTADIMAVAVPVLDGVGNALATSHSHTSTYTYRDVKGHRKTLRTSCYYGTYHSSCTTR